MLEKVLTELLSLKIEKSEFVTVEIHKFRIINESMKEGPLCPKCHSSNTVVAFEAEYDCYRCLDCGYWWCSA